MNAKGFHWPRAIFLAAVCGQTYTQYTNMDGTFVVPSLYAVVSSFKAKSINNTMEWFGFILESQEEIIVVFRGTSSTSDWASDIMAMQVPFTDVAHAGLTHRGITSIYQSARDQILSALGRLSAAKKLYITGHSLGGALATLCALDVAANSRFHSPHLYTYGAPRVGDGDFTNAFADLITYSYRINNPYDAVTHIPPFVFKLPRQNETYYYAHVQHSVALPFQNGSLSANHVIGSYFAELAKKDIRYAEQMCAANPGFCPKILK